MAHLILIYNILILLVLFISFNIPVFIFFKTKDKFLAHYILFFLPFILYTIALMIDNYLSMNFDNISMLVLNILHYSGELLFVSMMFAVAFFTNYIYSVKKASLINLILGIICLFLIATIPFHYTRIMIDGKLVAKYHFIRDLSTIVFVLVIIYFFIIGFTRIKKIKNIEVRNIAKSILIITLISFPGLLYDFSQKIFIHNYSEYITTGKFNPPFLIHPIFYTAISIACTYFIIKYYFKEYHVSLNEVPLASFVKEYDISVREKEVVELILIGKSNKEIADSLFISINTVKTHIKNIYEKIGIKSRYELLSAIKNI